MQPICETHPQLRALSQGLHLTLHSPTVLDQPVLQGDSDTDAAGASIYGSVIRDGGLFRMWYQAWPRDWSGGDAVTVACAESDDGLTWRRPSHGLVECCGTRDNHLTDLPFHCPSVLIDPNADADGRFRAFGFTGPNRLGDRFSHSLASDGYYTARSADGIHWQLESDEPLWPNADVITSVWDPWSNCARIALKFNGLAAGMYRRRFYAATWARGKASRPASAFIPDEQDDLAAHARGFCTADYYGVGLMPTSGPTIGFLWNFRHLPPLGNHEARLFTHYGNIGGVDLSIIYQPERNGRWLHLPGRPDWLAARDAPEWARGALYTAASPLDVGDETWLYFTGTTDLHGWCGHAADSKQFRSARIDQGGFARIGLLKWPRNRIIGYRADLPARLQLAPNPEKVPEGKLILNAVTRPNGQIRARLLDDEMNPLPGRDFEDCDPLVGDHLETTVRWRGQADLPTLPTHHQLTAELELTDATLYAFDFATSD
jgi:hypothetical protein